jgi:predicted DNA-binding ribbon-helix-helix protein
MTITEGGQYTKNELSKLTVDQLKEICKARKISSKGQKQDLVERILEDQKKGIYMYTPTELEKMFVKDLQGICKSHKLSSKGTKSELIDKILEYQSPKKADNDEPTDSNIKDIIEKLTAAEDEYEVEDILYSHKDDKIFGKIYKALGGEGDIKGSHPDVLYEAITEL